VNVFLLEPLEGQPGRPDPVASARSLCDVHVISQLKESAQILCTAARAHGYTDSPYLAGYASHPVTKWATRSRAAWLYVLAHARALNVEYMERYGTGHRSFVAVRWATRLDPSSIPERSMAPFALAMPTELRDPDDPVGSYRAYYARKEQSWAYKARRAFAAGIATGRFHGTDPEPHSLMKWSAGRVRPVWMPPEPPRRILTEVEAKAAAQFLPRVLGMPWRDYVKEHGQDIDDLLDIPPEEAGSRSAEFSGKYGSINSAKWRKTPPVPLPRER
jgi:hypothetical protein